MYVHISCYGVCNIHMQGKQDYLDVINQYLEIHATVSDIEVRACIKRGCTS